MKSILDKLGKTIKSSSPGLFSKDEKTLLDELGAGRKVTQEQAIAVLVSEIALCDLEFDKREYEFLFEYFKSKFGLKDGEIRNLIQQGTLLMANMQTTELFAQHLVNTMSSEEREELLVMVKGLIHSDEIEHGFELYLFDRLERLLGFEPDGQK